MLKKNKDHQGRWRSNTVTFRASKEEIKKINTAIALSGLSKQDYLIKRALQTDIIIVGNPRVFIRLKTKMDEIYKELIRLNSSDEINESLLETINLVSTIFSEATKEFENKGE